MRRAALVRGAVLACAVPFLAEASPAMADNTDFDAILTVCEATTLDEAAARGGRLGWPAAPDDAAWRADFERHNRSAVRVIGWHRSAREGDGRLSYWVASGRNAHTACAFATDRPGLLDALRARFGAPDTFEEHGDVVSAFWRRAGAEISFTRVGASSGLNLSRRG